MQTPLLRVKWLVGYSLTVLFILSFISSLSHVSHKSSPSPSLHVQVYGLDWLQTKHKKKNKVALTLNITADFRPLFSWNTKQIFLFVAAEYVTPRNSVNQISLWDRIVTTKEQAKFHIKTSNKYRFLDQASNLNLWEVPINITASWNVMPSTGFLVSDTRVIAAIHK